MSYAINEYERGVSNYLHGLHGVKVIQNGVAFVAKCKKSKITQKIMNAFQFSTMGTIIDAFPGIRSKVVIECAQ